uniref:Uncharacterized protein n=1 Tax=Haptolina brevifila TaxID=156173 RepID=A0A7S2HCX5_9EUKA|mmetsp:Transcript_53454/g.106327  ORF Transcript_53454/g.106327 Transcript_53454/m.106327 type:complete len:163 (+) Transcript_53454:116-604(+)|eukprot:CAMPEP_0174735812 /NCGR_PEP_ID=MMETSP1094-20130205/65585_1 /TAXON_ID=156173 /ORGANISM="Chrysochromulina brevifilum, Strain UTEX LB 985" /LENGTH=162 /DNA_ID=CAMNT_0015938815 /DNA_START=85 /DNA_END=573 /DNA_ORIENTATION=+
MWRVLGVSHSSWRSGFSDVDLALLSGALLAALILLASLVIVAYRAYCARVTKSGRREDDAPANASEYALLKVLVRAHNDEAELEVETDAFESYEDLREMVVDSLPDMFEDTDELTLEYQEAHSSRWLRVKRSTPVEALKASCSARISAIPASKQSSGPSRKR